MNGTIFLKLKNSLNFTFFSLVKRCLRAQAIKQIGNFFRCIVSYLTRFYSLRSLLFNLTRLCLYCNISTNQLVMFIQLWIKKFKMETWQFAQTKLLYDPNSIALGEASVICIPPASTLSKSFWVQFAQHSHSMRLHLAAVKLFLKVLYCILLLG